MLRNDIKELNEATLLKDFVWKDEEVLCNAEKRDEFGDPGEGAGDRRDGSADEDVETIWGFLRDKRRSFKDTLEERNERILDGDYVSLREVNVKGGDAATKGEWGANERGTGVWEGGKAVSKRKIFKREVDEEERARDADMRDN